MQSENVTRGYRLHTFQTTTAQLSVLPEVCAGLVALYDRAGREAHPGWESGDDPGNSGREGGRREACWEGPGRTQHEPQTRLSQSPRHFLLLVHQSMQDHEVHHMAQIQMDLHWFDSPPACALVPWDPAVLPTKLHLNENCEAFLLGVTLRGSWVLCPSSSKG